MGLYTVTDSLDFIQYPPPNRNSSSSSTAIISAQQSSSQPEDYDEEYNAMILEVADKLYSSLLKQLVSTIMDSTTTAELKSSSSQSKLP